MADPRPTVRRPKRGRLTRSADFDRVFRGGRSYGNRHLVLHLFPREEGGEPVHPAASGSGPRVGLSVSRKVGGAVERNRVKRVLREAAGEQAPRLGPGLDVVLVARPDLGDLVARDGLAGVRGALVELVDKALAAGGGRTSA